MLQKFVRGLGRNPAGVILLAGAIGVLSGVEHLLKPRPPSPSSLTGRTSRKKRAMPPTLDRFNIRRTQSELGYTYWVLQGHGQFRGFTLFDTWQEAVDEVQRRIGTSSRQESASSQRVMA